MILPKIYHIDVTGRCNLNCIHCRGMGKKDLATDEILTVLNNVYNSFGTSIEWIEISGGEPLLRKDLYKILKYIKRKFGWRIIVVSNGWYISRKAVEFLEKTGVERVQISLDGATEKTHNKIRRNPLAFKKAINAIKLLVSSKILTIARLVINQYNMNEVEKFFELCKQLGVNEIGIRCAVLAGNARENDLQINYRRYIDLLKSLHKLGEKYKIDYYSGDPLAVVFDKNSLEYLKKKKGKKWLNCLAGCSIGSAYLYTNSEGYICPCPNLQELKLGNALNNEIEKVWKYADVFVRCRTRNFDGWCGECKYKFICGGCRVFAKYLDNNLYGTDLRCPFAGANHSSSK